MNDRNPVTRDSSEPVTEAEFMEGMWISIGVGLYYSLNAFLPIIAWYGWRKYDILDMSKNKFYKAAWYTLYPLHWFAFTPMAFLWPFTYAGSSIVLDFYDIATWHLGTRLAIIIYGAVSFMWLLAFLFYSETEVITRRQIFQEMLLYMLIEGFVWYAAVYQYPVAHDQFYYANRIDLGDDVRTPKNPILDGDDTIPGDLDDGLVDNSQADDELIDF